MPKPFTKEKKDEQIAFRITLSLREAVQKFADADDRSESNAICLLLKRGLQAEGYKA